MKKGNTNKGLMVIYYSLLHCYVLCANAVGRFSSMMTAMLLTFDRH